MDCRSGSTPVRVETGRTTHTSGYAGVRLGEAGSPGPGEYERDHSPEPCARRMRINEAVDAVLGSQDSVTRGVQNLQLGDIPTAQPISVVGAIHVGLHSRFLGSKEHTCSTPSVARIRTHMSGSRTGVSWHTRV